LIGVAQVSSAMPNPSANWIHLERLSPVEDLDFLAMKILGTTTSPYTRKVRIAARAAGVEAELVDTRTPEGAELLAASAPLGKVPVLLTDGDPSVLPDSSLILDWLWSTRESALRAAGFDLDPRRWEDRAILVTVEGALDAAINRFYLKNDGVTDSGYVAKQRDRISRCLGALDDTMRFAKPVTRPVLSLGCFLDWAAFRNVIDLAQTPRLVEFSAAWQASGIGAGTEPD
jgi:glutathione S-transferase